MIKSIKINTHRQGLYEISETINAVLTEQDRFQQGLCSLFVRHTSCSLLIQENADPSAQHDLENWMNRLVPEDDKLYTHIYEGKDDMPAHIKASLTATQLSIPFDNQRLLLGTWQGIFLWEHRHARQTREIIIHLGN